MFNVHKQTSVSETESWRKTMSQGSVMMAALIQMSPIMARQHLELKRLLHGDEMDR